MVYTPFKPSDIDKRINLVELQLGCLFRPHKNCSVLFAIVPRWWWSTLLRLPSLDGCQHSATQHKNATTQFKDRTASNPQSHQLKLKLNSNRFRITHRCTKAGTLTACCCSCCRVGGGERGGEERSTAVISCAPAFPIPFASCPPTPFSISPSPCFLPSLLPSFSPPRLLSSAHLSPTPTSKLT